MKRKYLFLLLGLMLIISLIIYIASIIHTMSEVRKQDIVTKSSIIPADYSRLFVNINKLTFDKTIISKSRSPISLFDYDDKFRISVYRIDGLNGLSLKKIIKETHSNEHITYNLTYYGVDKFDQYEILYKAGRQEKASNIYLNLFGSGVDVLQQNDTLAYYYTKFENFYIKYDLSGPDDFFGRVSDRFPGLKIPIEIMFLRHKGNLYIIQMSVNQSKADLKPGTLLNIVSH